MPREKDGFREQLESIIAFYPNGECMNVSDVARYTGWNRGTVAKKYPFVGDAKGKYITRTQLAREMVASRAAHH